MSAEIEHQFARQAAGFEDPRLNGRFIGDAAWMLERVVLRGDELALDVAAGTGHIARALAPEVQAVVALDATMAMLETGHAAAEGLRNLVFLRGDAAALPFPDASFDLVTCRFAVHHFPAPAGPVGEMARVLRPGGTLVLADGVAVADPVVAAEQNRLERLRDPSHARLLTPAELVELVRAAGLREPVIHGRERERGLASWLDQTRTSPELSAEIEAALRGPRDTGFAPHEADGELRFIQRFVAVTARARS